jgi:hypothetical protein
LPNPTSYCILGALMPLPGAPGEQWTCAAARHVGMRMESAVSAHFADVRDALIAWCATRAGQKSLAEVAIPRRIHFIYERAARKFKSDLDLWLRWIALCKKLKSTKRLSKVKVVTRPAPASARAPVTLSGAASPGCDGMDDMLTGPTATAGGHGGVRGVSGGRGRTSRVLVPNSNVPLCCAGRAPRS